MEIFFDIQEQNDKRFIFKELLLWELAMHLNSQ